MWVTRVETRSFRLMSVTVLFSVQSKVPAFLFSSFIFYFYSRLNKMQAQSELWEQRLIGKTLVQDNAETVLDEQKVIIRLETQIIHVYSYIYS